MFRANMELADKIEESADDITAADTAPRPKNEIQTGQRYWSTIGKIISASFLDMGSGTPYSVSFQAAIWTSVYYQQQLQSPACLDFTCSELFVLSHFHPHSMTELLLGLDQQHFGETLSYWFLLGRLNSTQHFCIALKCHFSQ